MGKLTIAIDGHASTGKSSIAKKLAKSLGYIYINSGSMYRAVTLYAIENNLLELIDLDINIWQMFRCYNLELLEEFLVLYSLQMVHL